MKIKNIGNQLNGSDLADSNAKRKRSEYLFKKCMQRLNGDDIRQAKYFNLGSITDIQSHFLI